MSVWAITLLVLMAMSWAIVLAKHGEPQGNYHIGYHTISAFISIWILYMGGFFA